MVKVIHISTAWAVSAPVSIVIMVTITPLVSVTRVSAKALVVHVSSAIAIAFVMMACVSTEALVCHMALAIVAIS